MIFSSLFLFFSFLSSVVFKELCSVGLKEVYSAGLKEGCLCWT